MTSRAPDRTVKLLIAEDSSLFADAIVGILEEDPAIRVVGVAKNGEQALAMTESLRPDVVLMDVFMPVLDGLTAVQAIMAKCPTPIVVMTASPEGPTGSLAFEALSKGALDMVAKPTTWTGTKAEQDDLRARVKLVANIRVVRLARTVAPSQRRPLVTKSDRTDARSRQRVVGIGASTGGPPALARILGDLPADFPYAVLVVQHLSMGFDRQLVGWLREVSALRVELATAGMTASAGSVLVAPCEQHLVLEANGCVALSKAPAESGHRPSVDVLFSSLAMVCGSNGIGVELTGMGADGARGMLEMRSRGAVTIAQDEATSVIFGMPKAAIAAGGVKDVLPIEEIAPSLCRLAAVGTRRGEVSA